MTEKSVPESAKLARSGDRFSEKPLTDKIGNNLKQLYDEVLNEDVPDDFLAILSKADNDDK